MDRDEKIDKFEVESFYFNGTVFTEIHLSLNHINFDEKGNSRSKYSPEEVIELFVTAINGQFLSPEGEIEGLSYFVFNFENKKKYKAVFNTEHRKIFVRLITLF